MLYLKEQHPELDFRMVFQNANQKIKKGSKTSYADYCDKHGIKWANKLIPDEWYEDIYNDIAKNGEVEIQEEKDKPKRIGGRGR